MRQTVLITGSNGTLGRSILNKLGTCNVICPLRGKPDDDKSYFQSVKKYVTHIVNCVGNIRFNDTPQNLKRDNYDYLKTMLEVFDDSIPFAHVSTVGVFGKRSGLVNEYDRVDNITEFNNAYEKYKNYAERLFIGRKNYKIYRPSMILSDDKNGLDNVKRILYYAKKNCINLNIKDKAVDTIPLDYVSDVIVDTYSYMDHMKVLHLTSGQFATQLSDLDLSNTFCSKNVYNSLIDIYKPYIKQSNTFSNQATQMYLRGQ